MAYDKTNTFSLSKNKEKNEEHPNWPDYKGQININGKDHWLSAWIKTNGKTGDLSLLKSHTRQHYRPTAVHPPRCLRFPQRHSNRQTLASP